MNEYDYIVVGAGAAGCVLAYRLSADPSKTVLLLEAGGKDKHPFIHMPRGLAKIIASSELTWPFQTDAEDASNGAPEYWSRGRTMGGSTSINGMVYVRGQDADYQALAECVGEEWSWPHMAKAYHAMENHEFGETSFRGGDGPLRISLPETRRPLNDAIVEAGVCLGLANKNDVNEPADEERIGYLPCTIHKGRRQSAAVAFLDPVRKRENLAVVSHVLVDKVRIESGRATGVVVQKNGDIVEFTAKREVIVSGGALSSPAILQRSGIGPAACLERANVAVIVDAPEVGKNLREHRGVVMQWRVRDEVSENHQFKGAALLKNVFNYYLKRKGPMAGAAYEVGAWVKTQPDLDRPDVQILMAPFSFDYAAATLGVEARGGMNMAVYNLRPESKGSVMIGSSNPATLPAIKPNYYSESVDTETMVRGLKYARKLVGQAPLSQYVFEETRPGHQYQNDDELLEACRLLGYTNYHACGTCRAGRDSNSVVDSRLKVRGVSGLRVVDTSIFPFLLSGNTQGPAMVVAWRAADLIIDDQR